VKSQDQALAKSATIYVREIRQFTLTAGGQSPTMYCIEVSITGDPRHLVNLGNSVRVDSTQHLDGEHGESLLHTFRQYADVRI
jgi:hypothetical protein